MDGLRLKGEIMAAGVRVWDISVEVGMTYSKLSESLNNRRALSVNEVVSIRTAIDRLAARRRAQADGGDGNES
jgi:hypothetical protein